MPQDEQTPETQPEEARETEADEQDKRLLDDLDPDEAEAEDVTGGKRVSGRWDARY